MCGERVDLSWKYGLQIFGDVSTRSSGVAGHLKMTVIIEYQVRSLTYVSPVRQHLVVAIHAL